MNCIRALRFLTFTVGLLATSTTLRAHEPLQQATPSPAIQSASLATLPIDATTPPEPAPMPLHVSLCIAGMAGMVLFSFRRRYREHVQRQQGLVTTG